MKLIKYLFVLLILSLLVLIFTPLNLYYSQVSKNIRPLKLDGISGSVVKGSANNLSYLGMELGKVNWLLYPSSYNAVSIDLDLKDELYDLNATYIKTIKSEFIENFKGTADWALIETAINFNQGKISGYLSFDFSQVKIKHGVPERIVGKIKTNDLKLIRPIKKDLGDIEVVFTSNNPSIIVGQVNSNSNVLNVSGAVYIHKNHRWEIKLTLIPMPGEYEIDYALQNIGDRRSGGGRSLNMAGFY